MSDGIVFHDFYSIKTDRVEAILQCISSNKKKVTTGGTSGIILMKFRDLSKIIPKMNWSNVVDTLIGKKRNVNTIYIFKLKHLKVQKQGRGMSNRTTKGYCYHSFF